MVEAIAGGLGWARVSLAWSIFAASMLSVAAFRGRGSPLA